LKQDDDAIVLGATSRDDLINEVRSRAIKIDRSIEKEFLSQMSQFDKNKHYNT
jgi:hypothetical protein